MKALRLIAVIPLIAVSFAAEKVKVQDLLSKGAKYDGKVVTLVAPTVEFVQRRSVSGKPYFIFKVGTPLKYVSVFSHGTCKFTPKTGQKIEATGEFKVERKLGSRTYKNEIYATEQKGKPNGVKLAH